MNYLICGYAACFLLLAGCGALPGTKVSQVSLDKAVAGLEKDLKAIGHLSVSDMLSKNEKDRENARAYVQRKQRLYCERNPLILSTLLTNLTLNLKGTITEQGNFKITGILAVPGAEAAVTRTDATEQTLTIPVQMLSLGALPDFFLVGKFQLLKEYFGNQGISADDKAKTLKQINTDFDTIKTFVNDSMNAFDPTTCPK